MNSVIIRSKAQCDCFLELLKQKGLTVEFDPYTVPCLIHFDESGYTGWDYVGDSAYSNAPVEFFEGVRLLAEITLRKTGNFVCRLKSVNLLRIGRQTKDGFIVRDAHGENVGSGIDVEKEVLYVDIQWE